MDVMRSPWHVSQMAWYEFILLALMWGGALLSAITGIISTPMYQARRRDDPVEFWRAYWMLIGVVVIMTAFTIWM